MNYCLCSVGYSALPAVIIQLIGLPGLKSRCQKEHVHDTANCLCIAVGLVAALSASCLQSTVLPHLYVLLALLKCVLQTTKLWNNFFNSSWCVSLVFGNVLVILLLVFVHEKYTVRELTKCQYCRIYVTDVS